MELLLLFSIFVISTCGLIYELIAGTLASYLLGDSITQFSTIIGFYLFSMGVGSYLSKFIDKNLVAMFIQIEMLIGILGGFSTLILYVAFQYLDHFKPLLYIMIFMIGCCVGLEIPLLMRILKAHNQDFKELVSKVFTFDYIGALLASLLFPLVLVPYLGLAPSALLFGILNVGIGVLAIHVFKEQLRFPKVWYGKAVTCIALLIMGLIFSNTITSYAESKTYDGKVILSKSSSYQRIVLTRSGKDFKLFLNGNLQFSSNDEYRYHEALVHLGLSKIKNPKKILILGGGDGLAVREILKYPTIEKIILIDLDPEMTQLFKNHALLTSLNQNALNSPKVQVRNQDAFLWLKDNQEIFDFIVIDFPDPSNYSLGKLYTTTFYHYLYRALNDKGFAVIQSTSPMVSRKSYWCIAHTLEKVGFLVKPYLSYVPSFGLWGFQLAAKENIFLQDSHLPHHLRYITEQLIPTLFLIPDDLKRVETDINSLTNQTLVRYFENEWNHYAG